MPMQKNAWTRQYVKSGVCGIHIHVSPKTSSIPTTEWRPRSPSRSATSADFWHRPLHWASHACISRDSNSMWPDLCPWVADACLVLWTHSFRPPEDIGKLILLIPAMGWGCFPPVLHLCHFSLQKIRLQCLNTRVFRHLKRNFWRLGAGGGEGDKRKQLGALKPLLLFTIRNSKPPALLFVSLDCCRECYTLPSLQV